MSGKRNEPSLGGLVSAARKARDLSLRELGGRLTAGGRRPRGVSAQFLNDSAANRLT